LCTSFEFWCLCIPWQRKLSGVVWRFHCAAIGYQQMSNRCPNSKLLCWFLSIYKLFTAMDAWSLVHLQLLQIFLHLETWNYLGIKSAFLTNEPTSITGILSNCLLNLNEINKEDAKISQEIISTVGKNCTILHGCFL
jgi:hypothetical protein